MIGWIQCVAYINCIPRNRFGWSSFQWGWYPQIPCSQFPTGHCSHQFSRKDSILSVEPKPFVPTPADFYWWVRPDMTPREIWTGPPCEIWTTRRGRRHCSRFSPPKVRGASSPGFAGFRMGRWWDSSSVSCDRIDFRLFSVWICL